LIDDVLVKEVAFAHFALDVLLELLALLSSFNENITLLLIGCLYLVFLLASFTNLIFKLVEDALIAFLLFENLLKLLCRLDDLVRHLFLVGFLVVDGADIASFV
jgi:hypothetical protein